MIESEFQLFCKVTYLKKFGNSYSLRSKNKITFTSIAPISGRCRAPIGSTTSGMPSFLQPIHPISSPVKTLDKWKIAESNEATTGARILGMNEKIIFFYCKRLPN